LIILSKIVAFLVRAKVSIKDIQPVLTRGEQARRRLADRLQHRLPVG
jgi:hypothetical protein